MATKDKADTQTAEGAKADAERRAKKATGPTPPGNEPATGDQAQKGLSNEPAPVGGENFHYPGGEAQYNADHGKVMGSGGTITDLNPDDDQD